MSEIKLDEEKEKKEIISQIPKIDFSHITLNMQKIGEYMVSMMKPIRETVSRIQENISAVTSPLLESLGKLALVIEEAKNDPDSLINYFRYMENMEKYFWVMPYNISTAKLKELIDNKLTEEQFDKEMLKHFNKETIISMINDIERLLPRKYKVIFRQIKNSFYDKEYALINGSIISIIDGNFLSLLKNKDDTKRTDILVPIIKETDDDLLYVTMTMINNSLNTLYKSISFSKIEINTHKKVRRHPSLHGVQFSNKRIDSIMLLNLLYYVLSIKDYLIPYKNTLVCKRNKQDNSHYYEIKR